MLGAVWVGRSEGGSLRSHAVADRVLTQLPKDLVLTPLVSGELGTSRPVMEWLTTFHLASVVLDPYTNIHEAFLIARSGRPGPVVIDIPKDIQFANGAYIGKDGVHKPTYHPNTAAHPDAIAATVDLMLHARRPVFYTGGGVINSGPEAARLLRELQKATGYPVTSTLMGLGAFPAGHPDWLGMVGMHGSFEANNAMHDCDLMICVGARFDDRVTGRIDAFSPNSKKVHIDIDPSSINKIVRVDIPVIADCAEALGALLKEFKSRKGKKPDLKPWKQEIDIWRARNCFAYTNSESVIKPQYAVQRLYELTRGSCSRSYSLPHSFREEKCHDWCSPR